MNALELKIQRNNTAAFIRADALPLVLRRRTRVRVKGQWLLGEEEPLPAQIFRLIPAEDAPGTVETPDGTTATVSGVLLGAYDADLMRGDVFSVGDVEYWCAGVVMPEHTTFPYFRKVQVVRRGPR